MHLHKCNLNALPKLGFVFSFSWSSSVSAHCMPTPTGILKNKQLKPLGSNKLTSSNSTCCGKLTHLPTSALVLNAEGAARLRERAGGWGGNELQCNPSAAHFPPHRRKAACAITDRLLKLFALWFSAGNTANAISLNCRREFCC